MTGKKLRLEDVLKEPDFTGRFGDDSSAEENLPHEFVMKISRRAGILFPDIDDTLLTAEDTVEGMMYDHLGPSFFTGIISPEIIHFTKIYSEHAVRHNEALPLVIYVGRSYRKDGHYDGSWIGVDFIGDPSNLFSEINKGAFTLDKKIKASG